jgi:hypothetical protein
MAKEHKGKSATAPAQNTSAGEHGGNRGGDQKNTEDQRKQSNQAAGKDPNRGSR